MIKNLFATVVVAMLMSPAGAAAATKVYAGTTDGAGQFAMDVVVNKKGKLKGITELRGNNIPVTCEQSGANTVYFTFPTSIKVSKHHKFYAEWSQPTYGNKSWVRGAFAPKRVASGTLHFDQHFLADQGLPEENCSSADLAFRVERGAPDVVPPSSTSPRPAIRR
jgi:hypothetical protein